MIDLRGLFDLTGRVACVTGASAGLGLQAANVLASAGAQVIGVAQCGPNLRGTQWAAG